MKNLRERFIEFCGDSAGSDETFGLLHKLYSEPHRAYHNLDHVRFLLALFDEFSERLEDKITVFFTIWFHDAVYDPQKKDNEKQSARLAAERLRKSIVPPEKISKIVKLILATEKHSAENLDSDGKLFLDFDLAILGSDGGVYGEYAKAIRKEYSFVSENDYKIGRGKILRDFLRRDFIFLTDIMRESFEANARRNIEREILEL